MKEEDEVVTSPLSRSLELDGKQLKINIYKGTYRDDDWMLEVIDGEGRSYVFNEMYLTDESALAAAMKTVQKSS
jgi:hypothetical protein